MFVQIVIGSEYEFIEEKSTRKILNNHLIKFLKKSNCSLGLKGIAKYSGGII